MSYQAKVFWNQGRAKRVELLPAREWIGQAIQDAVTKMGKSRRAPVPLRMA